MSKALPWILVAALVVLNLFDRWRIKKTDDAFQELLNVADRAIDIADSLRTANAALEAQAMASKATADSLTRAADSLMRTDPRVIVNERVKLNRYATAEKVGRGLVKQLP